VQIDKQIPATWMQYHDDMQGIVPMGGGFGYWACPDGSVPIKHESKGNGFLVVTEAPTCGDLPGL
jgi:hypothetical protein